MLNWLHRSIVRIVKGILQPFSTLTFGDAFRGLSDARFFTFESSSQLTRTVRIIFANETGTYYQFAKSSNVRENGVYRRQFDERSRFDTTLWMASSLPPSGKSCTISFDAINGLVYSPSFSLNVLFGRIVTSHHSRISP